MAENKENQIVGLVKASSNILCQIYQDLAQPSVRALGQALATIFELCPTSLLSLKLWSEKRKLIFQKHLNKYAKKLEDIPAEKRCEVDTQIGTPIVERLTYTTNDEIADLFTTLLAMASNTDTKNRAHPSFIHIIESMSPDEAIILCHMKDTNYIPYCEIRAESSKGYDILEDCLTTFQYDLQLEFSQNIGAYLSNFVSLGILSGNRDFMIQLNASEDYDRMLQCYGLENLKNELVPSKYSAIYAKKDFFIITSIGKLFLKACVK